MEGFLATVLILLYQNFCIEITFSYTDSLYFPHCNNSSNNILHTCIMLRVRADLVRVGETCIEFFHGLIICFTCCYLDMVCYKCCLLANL